VESKWNLDGISLEAIWNRTKGSAEEAVDGVTVLLVAAVAAVVLAVTLKVGRDADLVGARELVRTALVVRAALVLVRRIAFNRSKPLLPSFPSQLVSIVVTNSKSIAIDFISILKR